MDRGDAAGDLHISNQASLAGVAGGEAGDDTVLADVSSSTASKRELTVYKVDAENYGTLLQGAVFTLEEYENGGWTTRRSDLTTDENGQFTLVCTDDEQFPEFTFRDGVLYRLTETSPPPDYAIPPQGCVYHFVWVGADQTVEACRRKLAGTVAAAGAQLEDVLFFDNPDAIFVPNESTTVQVKKLWLNEDGGALAGAGPVEVTLWRQASWTQATLSFPVQVAGNSCSPCRLTPGYPESMRWIFPASRPGTWRRAAAHSPLTSRWGRPT